MFPEERKQKICDIVAAKKSVKVTELSQLMDISEVTIRRDLDELHKQNRITRTHGGAIARYSVGKAISAPELIYKNVDEKQRIAHLAYQHLEDNDTVLCDSSSTVFELTKLIANGTKKSIVVVTNSIMAITTFAKSKNAKLIFVGGAVNYGHSNCEGTIAKETIQSLRADKCFIGINGIDETFGYSTPRFEDAEIKRHMLQSAMQSYILADKTKFGMTYLARVKAECDFIITDEPRPDYGYDWLEERTTLQFASRELAGMDAPEAAGE